MMSKERLEEIKEQLEESNSYDDNPNGYWYHNINWLIEQAERVQELEEENRFQMSETHKNLDKVIYYDKGKEARQALERKGD